MRKIVMMVALTAVACSGAQKKDGTHVEQEPITFEDPPDKPKPKLEGEAHLSVAKIDIVDGDAKIEINADGKVVFQGKHVATVLADGRMLAQTGGLLAKLSKDGKLSDTFNKNPILATLTVGPDGGLSQGENALATVAEDGTVTAGGKTLKLEGPAEARRTAMYVYLILTIPQSSPEPKPDPAATPAPEPTTTPAPAANPCGG